MWVDKINADSRGAVQEGRSRSNVLTNLAQSATPAPRESDWMHCAYCDTTFLVDYAHAFNDLKRHLTLCKASKRIKGIFNGKG